MDGLVVIGNGSVAVAFSFINDATVYKGHSVLGIEANSLVAIGNGSVVVALVPISNAADYKSASVVGVGSDRFVNETNCLVVVGRGLVEVPFPRKGEATI